MKKIKALIEFHKKNKLLLMSYNQEIMRKAGRMVADAKKIGFDKTYAEYEKLLGIIMSKPYKISNLINSLEHAFGYFKNNLSKNEKEFFLKNFKKFASGKIGALSVLTLLKSYIIRFDEKYLSKQTLFYPYPEELM